MLMFLLHIAFSVCLIAGVSGMVLLYLSKKTDTPSCGTGLRIGGYVVLIASVLNIACLSYYAIRYSEDSAYSKPYPQMMGGGSSGMPDMMRMMGGMMKNKMGGKGPSPDQPPLNPDKPGQGGPDGGGPASEEEHKEHHPE